MENGKSGYKIYKYTNKINGKIYIGQTKQTLYARAQRDGLGYQSCTLFWRAIQKYGWENFEPTILEDNLTQKEANEREEYYISFYDSTNHDKGYNLRLGGRNSSLSEETKKKISDSHKGIRPSEESRKKMSEWHKMHPPSPEFLLKSIEKRKKKVRCLNTNEVFDSITEAQKHYNTGHTISDACKGKRGSCGIHPETGEPLRWKYEEDYQKEIEIFNKYNSENLEP